ncbi:hypothetical protein Q6249_29805, partial [Klebsiella pneumoniae]
KGRSEKRKKSRIDKSEGRKTYTNSRTLGEHTIWSTSKRFSVNNSSIFEKIYYLTLSDNSCQPYPYTIIVTSSLF